MKCIDEALYRQTLLALQSQGIEFCVIGTFGLGLFHAEWPVYPVKDCDLMVKNDPENLNKLASALQALHWQLYLWQESVACPLPLERLSGKYYLRALQHKAVLDATYECDFISWQQFKEQAQVIEGIPVASIGHILYLKHMRNTPKDREQIEKLMAVLR